MPDALFYALILAAGLACPAHMWWAQRRGKRAACCPPKRQPAPQDLEELLARRSRVEAQIAATYVRPSQRPPGRLEKRAPRKEEGRRLAASEAMMFTPGIVLAGKPFSYGLFSERKFRRELNRRVGR